MADWDKIEHRGNVEDRRWSRMAPMVWWIGVTGLLVVLAVWMIWWQESAFEVLDTLQQNSSTNQQEISQTTEFDWKDKYEVFISTVLWSNDYLWTKTFYNSWLEYIKPKLVLFRGSTNSACGWAVSQIWPHYCPTDKTIYLDETFFDELVSKFWAKWWDVAEAYVISHEVWHHIQNQLWFMERVQKIRRNNPSQANKASVKLELQADCIAWIWASTIAWKGVLEQNEISEAIDAAWSVWDDRIQKAATWEVHPESWTHGSSADRKKWFNIWYKYWDFEKCNTFK